MNNKLPWIQVTDIQLIPRKRRLLVKMKDPSLGIHTAYVHDVPANPDAGQGQPGNYRQVIQYNGIEDASDVVTYTGHPSEVIAYIDIEDEL